jgi:hypothetical protein
MIINTSFPLPPTDLVMPSLWQMVFLIVTSLTLIVTTAIAIRSLLKDHDVIPLLSVLGGILTATTIEFIIGPAGLLWYPGEGQMSFIQAGERSLPLFVASGNGFWYGPAIILFGSLVSKATSCNKIWLLFAAVLAVDLGMEAAGIAAGVFVYYGNQGVRILGMPLWWLMQNAALTVFVGWIITQLRKTYFKGWRSLLIIPIMPCLAMAANGFNGLFGWLAIHTANSWSVYLGTLISVAMALISVDLLAHVQINQVKKLQS